MGQPRRVKPRHCAGSSQLHPYGGEASHWAQGTCTWGGLEVDTAPQGERAPPSSTRRRPLWACQDGAKPGYCTGCAASTRCFTEVAKKTQDVPSADANMGAV